MKFVCQIEGTQYLLSPSHLEILVSALSNAEMLTDIDVGKGKGTHGYAEQYIHGVKETTLQQNLRLSVMDDEAYETAKFIAKQHEGKKS
jgi:hypothetical protein